MNIILEGPDHTGKSTLAAAISKATGWIVKSKEGRPATQLLLFEKFRKYEALDGMIIDRHPIISQSVYGIVRGDEEIPREFTANFFARREDIVIYCRCERDLADHIPSDTDTPEHLQMIEDARSEIFSIYDNWATLCAHIIYNRYEDLDLTVAMVKGALHERGRC